MFRKYFLNAKVNIPLTDVLLVAKSFSSCPITNSFHDLTDPLIRNTDKKTDVVERTNGLYSNFEKLGHKYGLTQLLLRYDTPKGTHDVFIGGIKFSFFGAGGPYNVGFQLSQKTHGSSFYPVLEINWADMEKNDKIIFGDNFSDNPTAHAWVVDSLLEVFAIAVQQTYLEILALGTPTENSGCGTGLTVPELSVSRNFVNKVDHAEMH